RRPAKSLSRYIGSWLLVRAYIDVRTLHARIAREVECPNHRSRQGDTLVDRGRRGSPPQIRRRGAQEERIREAGMGGLTRSLPVFRKAHVLRLIPLPDPGGRAGGREVEIVIESRWIRFRIREAVKKQPL